MSILRIEHSINDFEIWRPVCVQHRVEPATRKRLQKVAKRRQIEVLASLAGVIRRSRGTPQTAGDEPRCSIWFP